MEIIKIYKTNIEDALSKEITEFLQKSPNKNIKDVVCILKKDVVCGAAFLTRMTRIEKKKVFVVSVYVLPECRNRSSIGKDSLLNSAFDILKKEKDFDGVMVEVRNKNVTEEILNSWGFVKVSPSLNTYVKYFKE